MSLKLKKWHEKSKIEKGSLGGWCLFLCDGRGTEK